MASLTATVIGAIKGDAKSQEALAEMSPLVGTWKAGQEVDSLKSQGKHFEAGVKFTEFAVSAAEDSAMVYGAATGVVSGIAGAVKILRKALKHARPPRGALAPRHLPDFTPNEGHHAPDPSKPFGRDVLLASETLPRWTKMLKEKYGGKVRLDQTPKAIANLKGAGAKFSVVGPGEAKITIGTMCEYNMYHEMKHADHFLEKRCQAFS